MSAELTEFARCFTRDWRSRGDSFYAIAYEYIKKLPSDRKEVLANEYRAFLYQCNTESDEALLQRWLEQGAEVWDDDVNLRPVLTDFYWMLQPDAPEFGAQDGQPVGRGTVVVELPRNRPKE